MKRYRKYIKRKARSIKSALELNLKKSRIHSRTIRVIESTRGFRYPENLIGRRNVTLGTSHKTRVLVIAAHPDDEVLGAGLTLAKHRAQEDSIVVVFTTNGSGGNWRAREIEQRLLAAIRFSEACSALSVIGIPSESIVNLGFPDGGLHRYVAEATRDIEAILIACDPKVVYVHAIEGGHIDHDFTSFIVQNVCARLGFDSVFEWAEYNKDFPCGSLKSKSQFASDPYVNAFDPVRSSFSKEEAAIKGEMLSRYASQALAISGYPFEDEILRQAKPVHLVDRLAHFRELQKRAVYALVR